MYGQQSYSPYSYMPTNYGAPNNYGQRQFMQPQQQMNPQQMQTNTNISQQTVPLAYETQTAVQAVRFATEDEAKAFIVYPNLTAVFIDEAKGKIYLKSANGAGVSSIRKYNEVKEEMQEKKIENSDFSQKPQVYQQQIDPNQFASKEQLKGLTPIQQHNELVERCKFMEEQMRIMQKQLNGSKMGVATTTAQPLNK